MADTPDRRMLFGRDPFRRLNRALPIAVKLLVAALLVASSAAWVVVGVQVRDMRSAFLREYEARAGHLARLVSTRYGAGRDDPVSMNVFLSQLVGSIPDLDRAVVRIAAGGARSTWARADDPYAPRRAGGDRAGPRLLDLSFPLDFGGRPVGRIEFGFSPRSMERAVSAARKDLVVVVVPAAIAGVLAMGVLFYGLVYRRLSRLSRAASRVAAGDLSVRLPEGAGDAGRDELYSAAREFDHVTRSIDARIRQQAAVTVFGNRALSGDDVSSLARLATKLLADGLGAGGSTIVEATSGGPVIRYGHGWPQDVTGVVLPPTSLSSYTMKLGEPVISEDMQSETRFVVHPLLLDQGIRSAITTVIPGPGRPWGILAAHTYVTRRFSPDDTHFIQSIANTLGAAIRHRDDAGNLRRAEERYRGVVERLRAVTYIAPVEPGPWVFVSPQIESLLGYTPEEWMEDPILWRRCVHPDDLQGVLARERDAMAKRRPFSLDYRMRARDGSLVWVRDEAVVVREGNRALIQGFMYDQTEQRRAADALRSAFEREREAAERLRSVDEMKNAFLTAVSHELRTPLASVFGYALTLEQEDIALSEEDRQMMVSRLAANARKLERLLGDLLDVDRLAQGLLEPHRQLVDVGALVRKTIEEIDVGQHAVSVEAPPLVAHLDGPKVERIVENLVVNAAKHTEAGCPVRVRVARDDGAVRIAVEDEGHGVPDDLKEQVFDPFRQGETPSHAPGTGIGLSLVARFAELHGGRAWVEDRPGGGASFQVLLPEATASGSR